MWFLKYSFYTYPQSLFLINTFPIRELSAHKYSMVSTRRLQLKIAFITVHLSYKYHLSHSSLNIIIISSECYSILLLQIVISSKKSMNSDANYRLVSIII